MGKIIAVWGNNGSGKSLISCALGNALTAKNTNVIILSSDKLTPMLNVFLPFLEAKPNSSLGIPLSDGIINLQGKIHVHNDNGCLGFMSLSPGENGLTYQTNWSANVIRNLLETLNAGEFAQYIVIDCTSNPLDDSLTLYALEHADTVINVLSPDTRGISFLQSQLPILRSGNFRVDEYITILNNCYAYSPASQIAQDYGCQYILPHAKDAYTRYIGGQLIKNLYEDTGVDFERAINMLTERSR